MLHILAGTVFAVCGAQITYALNKNNNTSYFLATIFGVFLSISIAVFWEIFEFSSDIFLGSDMQADTIINTIATKVGRTDGGLTVFSQINDVVINGTSLGVGGYIDIGIMDTMNDMIVETVGALIFLVYALVDRARHPMIVSLRAEKINSIK